MDLRGLLARAAAGRVHVLLVEVPGWHRLRMEVEVELARRGWPLALSSADADFLLVCGAVSGTWEEVLHRTWDQMPSPRARGVVGSRDELIGALEAGRADLADDAQQRHDFEQRLAAMADQQHGEPGDGEPDDGEHGTMAHENMGHGEMDMPMPGGIAMAMGGQDRDGLDLDELHVQLGPVLAHWPAGLVVRCCLQGDVIVAAQVEVMVPDVLPDAVVADWRDTAVRSCDAASRLLGAAGWGRAAAEAVRIRDGLLGGGDRPRWALPLARLERRVLRSRLLRWSLRGVPSLGADLSLSSALAELGDRLQAAQAAVADQWVDPHLSRSWEAGAMLGELITGVELAEARLVVVASVPDTVAWARAQVTGG